MKVEARMKEKKDIYVKQGGREKRHRKGEMEKYEIESVVVLQEGKRGLRTIPVLRAYREA